MTSAPIRQVPSLTTARKASSTTTGLVADAWDYLAALRDAYRDNRAWIQFCAVAGVVLLAVTIWLSHFRTIMGLWLAAYTILVLWAWRQVHHDAVDEHEHGDRLGWAYPRRWLGRMLLVPALDTALALVAVNWQLRVLVSLTAALGILHLLAVMDRPEPEPDSRWQEQALRDAFLAAGAVKGGFTRLGAPQSDATGEWQTLKLSPGEVWSDFAAKQAAIASGLDVDADLLTIEHAGGPPNQVRVHIAERGELVERQVVTSSLMTAARTDWRDPVRIGVDSQGEPVHLLTAEHNTLIAGVMGFGKTVSARMPLGHFLLDPTTTLYAADGKSSRRDYGGVAPLCEQFVWGTDEDAPEQMLHMLRDVLNVVRDRNANDYEGAEWPGLLLLLEEFQDIRAGAEKGEREEIDKTLGRIVRMGRAVSEHTLISTQRPSVEDLPSGTRNLIDQRLALVLRNGQDASLVLGHTPPKHLPTPSRRGEAIFADPATDRATYLDYIDGPAWKALCARAALLRRRDVTTPPREQVQLVKTAPVTLLSEVTKALAGGPLLAVDLYQRIAPSVRPATSSVMGRALMQYPQLASQKVARGRIWSLVAVTAERGVTPQEASTRSNEAPGALPSLALSPAVGDGGQR